MIYKRLFDICFSLIALLILSPLILLIALVQAFNTSSNVFFVQQRIGQYGLLFRIIKLRSLGSKTNSISHFGKFLRKSKIDELPQLYNVFIGEMSFVGPRPDIPGYANLLTGNDRLLLTIKPGLTGLASLKYHNEETLLAQQPDPLQYNDTIIWPDKVLINNWYAKHHTFFMDLTILFYTAFPFLTFDTDAYIEKYKSKKPPYNNL